MAKGDLIVRRTDGQTSWLPVGSNGQVLAADSGQTLGVKWQAAGGGLVALADGGTGSALTDPNADRIMFWDDSAGAVTWLTAGTNLTITGTTIAASGGGGGSEVGYDQVTTSVTVSSTTESSGTTVIACAAHTFDGSPVIATFFCPNVGPLNQVGAAALVSLFEGATEISRLCYVLSPINAAFNQGLTGILRFTPTAGSHTYTVTAIQAVQNATLTCGSGGTAGWPPMFIRFTKA